MVKVQILQSDGSDQGGIFDTRAYPPASSATWIAPGVHDRVERLHFLHGHEWMLVDLDLRDIEAGANEPDTFGPNSIATRYTTVQARGWFKTHGLSLPKVLDPWRVEDTRDHLDRAEKPNRHLRNLFAQWTRDPTLERCALPGPCQALIEHMVDAVHSGLGPRVLPQHLIDGDSIAACEALGLVHRAPSRDEPPRSPGWRIGAGQELRTNTAAWRVVAALRLRACTQPELPVALGTGGTDARPNPGGQTELASEAPNIFRLEEGLWHIRFQGKSVRMPPNPGHAILCKLLRSPGIAQNVTALDGFSAPRPDDSDEAEQGSLSRGDQVVDSEALAEFKRRFTELSEERERLQELGQSTQLEAVQEKIGQLADAIAAAQGLGGRSRRIGDEHERCRVRVGQTLRRLLAKLEPLHPGLCAHLRESIQNPSGSTPSYSPRTATDWILV